MPILLGYIRLMKRVITVIVLLVPWVAGAREVPRPDLPRVESAIVAGTNDFRRRHGRGEVASDARLAAAARDFARYMAAHGKLSHEADGRKAGERITAHGYRYCMYAENISYQHDTAGFETARLAAGLLDGWKESAGHRANMLKREAVHTGVGVARSARNGYYYAVQLFGSPRPGSGRC
jgi:uncharacterized protein YkwD